MSNSELTTGFIKDLWVFFELWEKNLEILVPVNFSVNASLKRYTAMSETDSIIFYSFTDILNNGCSLLGGHTEAPIFV